MKMCCINLNGILLARGFVLCWQLPRKEVLHLGPLFGQEPHLLAGLLVGGVFVDVTDALQSRVLIDDIGELPQPIH